MSPTYDTNGATRKGLSPQEIRKRLKQAGYLPVPIAYRDKRPLMRNWQSFVYDPENPCPPAFFGIPHPATGVRCDGLMVFDIDVEDAVMRDDIRDIIERHCGESPAVRFRDRSAKLALFYRPEPHFTTGEGARFRIANRQKLEVYGQPGLQILVHGEHAASTDDHPVFYRWEEDPLWEIPRAELPGISQTQVRGAVTEVVRAYPPQDGAEASLSGSAEPPQACVGNILLAEDFHASTVSLAGSLAATGMPPEMVIEYIDWVYSAVDLRQLSVARQQDYFARRADIRRCVIDVARRELKKADSAYAGILTEAALNAARMKGHKRG